MPKKKSFEVSSNDYNLIKQNYIVSGKKLTNKLLEVEKNFTITKIF